MDFEYISLENPAPHICRITLFRPQVANAMNKAMAEELSFAMKQADAHQDIRAVILTGEGPKVFCSGADLKERKGMNKTQWQAQHAAFEEALDSIAGCHKPVIAAINGAAYAGGLELALACDFMIAAEHATFAFTEANLGIMPGLGGTIRLPQAIGPRRALQMLLTANPIGAKKALSYGLVNEVIEAKALGDHVLQIAMSLAQNAPLALSAIKKIVHEAASLDSKKATRLELQAYNKLIETQDRKEGINAFNEKRKPVFKGK